MIAADFWPLPGSASLSPVQQASSRGNSPPRPQAMPFVPSASTCRRRDLVDLRRRIAATRWPDRETVDDQSQGVQLAKFQELVRYWGNGLRLAQGRGEAQRPAAIHDDDRRAWTFTSSTSARVIRTRCR